MPSVKKQSQQQDLGKLYSQINVEREVFEESDKKLEKRTLHPFVAFCKKIYKSSPSLGGKNAKFSSDFQDAINFLGWELKPEELSAAATLTMIVSGAVFVGSALVLMLFLGSYLETMFGPLGYLYVFGPSIVGALLLTYMVQNYPLEAAKTEQVKALTYVPEIMGYMIMSMKLVPNLEKAVEFAAEHGKGKVSEDLKKLLWDLELGVFNTLSEGLDAMALRWGKYSSEFKESLMMIRASVLEDTEAKRYALLDKTMSNLLESVKNKMEQYARELSQPSISLFYLGVLLPLILIIILPVGSAFSGQALARPEILIFLYNILIPVVAFVFAMNVIKKRPPTYEAPVIPDNHPLLPKKGTVQLGNFKTDLNVLLAVIIVVGFGASGYLHFFGAGVPGADGAVCIIPGEDKGLCFLADKTPYFALQKSNKPENYFAISENPGDDTLLARYLQQSGGNAETAKALVLKEQFKFFSQPENDTSPQTLIFGVLLTLGLVLFVYLYFGSIEKRKIQIAAMKVEGEFKEALYILASRMGENKPVEDAMKHVRDFLPNYAVSTEVFGQTVHNIEVLGMPLEEALFDPTFGSLRNNPSNMIKSSMRLVVDSVQLGVEVSSRTIASLSMQLSNQEKVSQNLKVLVSDVSQMMRLMSTIVGPAILGVTVSLQKIVMGTLSNVVSVVPNVQGDVAGMPSELGNLTALSTSFSISPETMQSLVSPSLFLLIVALYVVQIVFILMYFTSKIEEDNEVAARLNIAKSIPVAIIVFLVCAVLSSIVVGNVRLA